MPRSKPFLIFVFPIVLMVSGCGFFNPFYIEIQNETQSTMTNISVSYPGQDIDIYEINSGSVETVRGFPSRDGVIELRFRRDGAAVKEEITYISRNVGGKCIVRVQEDAVVESCTFG